MLARPAKSLADLANAPRPVRDIALEIYRSWPNVSPAAKPYLLAMTSLRSVDDDYGLDSGRSVVGYFLANASGWRGEIARRVKVELKAMLVNKLVGSTDEVA